MSVRRRRRLARSADCIQQFARSAPRRRTIGDRHSPGAQIVGGRAPPFAGFAAELDRHEGRRAALDALYRAPETEVVPALIAAADLPPEVIEKAQALARKLVTALRERPAPGLVQSLMREYALSSQEGVALMCLGEALLRIPDAATRNALIADKIGGANGAPISAIRPRRSSMPRPGAC